MGKGDDPARAVRILAKSMFDQLRADGYGRLLILQFATEVLELLLSVSPAAWQDERPAGEKDRGRDAKHVAREGRRR